MKAAVITIGDEILLGQITDTNSQWIAARLSDIGISVERMVSVADKKEEIISVLENLSQRYPLAIVTGGLGPTGDDITKKTLAEFFGDTLVLYPGVEKRIESMFAAMNMQPVAADRQQAMLPSRAEILPNEIGTASGMWFDSGEFQLISLPGVPSEMKELMDKRVIPELTTRFELPHIIRRTWVTYGLRESLMSERLADFERSLPGNVSLAYLPNYRRLRLRLSVRHTGKAAAHESMKHFAAALEKELEGLTFNREEEGAIEEKLGALMTDRGLTLSVAESFTGGHVLSLLTKIPGASRYLKGGVVAYHKEIKTSELSVSRQLIDVHSVVSAEVAEAMAEGIRKKFNTDYGIATTGNAGPTTDDTTWKAGDVFLAISSKSGTYSKYFNLGQPRAKVIERGTSKLLEMLYREILKNT